ncbi:uncharacterized protein F4822DRAFT_428586 [Hypoxylon trugodes]|uniref:uncharacterized protein n=1 Tax=Hypoxylon trugodes TaxID=326681 RepID=UPI00219FF9D1|nr:uncharacterized protein F4822DRAFT_428586 [Hypoxylon trugodes]KAI1390247.1 hypothetical protein F4822DRAFT_428586 [Hypoxylon trugodes]
MSVDSNDVDNCSIPDADPPDGITPNFINPPTMAPTLISIAVVLNVWATVFVVARLYANRFKLHASDYLTALALILNITYAGIEISISKHFRHTWDIPVCWITVKYMITKFALYMVGVPRSLFSKWAVLLLYRQLFGVNKLINVAVWIGVIFTLLISIFGFVVEIIVNAPKPGQSWEEWITTPEDEKTYELYENLTAVGNNVRTACIMAVDLYIVILPLPAISRLHLPLKKRLQLFALFAIAFSAVIASILPLVYSLGYLRDDDGTWVWCYVEICNTAEISVAIIAGSALAFAKFVKTYIAGSSTVRMLRLKLRIKPPDHSHTSPTPVPPPLHGTIGSPPRKHPRHYLELNDTVLMETQASTDVRTTYTAGWGSQEEILRTIDVIQDSRPGSSLRSTDKYV